MGDAALAGQRAIGDDDDVNCTEPADLRTEIRQSLRGTRRVALFQQCMGTNAFKDLSIGADALGWRGTC